MNGNDFVTWQAVSGQYHLIGVNFTNRKTKHKPQGCCRVHYPHWFSRSRWQAQHLKDAE